MKLTDLTYKIGSVVRDATNVVRYPFQVVAQKVRDVAQEKLEQIEVPLSGRSGKVKRESLSTQTSAQTHQGTKNGSVAVQSLNESGSVATRIPIADWMNQSATLPRECSGRRGKYQLETLLDSEAQTHLYQGVWLQNHAPVLIQEYLLSQSSPEALRQGRENLERLESVRLKNSTGQDFRLITPWDTAIAIAEKRGYLVTQYCPEKSKTLKDYLKQYLAMPTQQVRQVLLQVLQTLWFLHNHPIRFTDGTVQYGLLHGNLSLSSLIIASDPQPLNGQEPAFYIYVKDLALWQIPFQSLAKAKASSPQKVVPTFESLQAKFFQRDLASLGAVGFCLLTGDRSDRAFQPGFKPDGEPRWEAIVDTPLKKFIRQLWGADPSTFISAEAAYRALLNPIAEEMQPIPEAVSLAAIEETQRLGCLWLLLLGLLLGLGGWWLVRSLAGQAPIILMQSKTSPTAIRDVSVAQGLPSIKFAVSDAWQEVIGTHRSSFNKSLLQELGDRDHEGGLLKRLQLGKIPNDASELQQMLQSGKLAFVLNDSASNISAPDLEQKTIAYDGVAVFVAFSDVYRNKNIPKRLHGEITLEQLQKAYVGDAKGFRTLFPADPIATKVFQRVLFPDPKQDRLIQQFKRLQVDDSPQPVDTMFQAVLKTTFEDGKQDINIGFARLSQVYGQCSVYPLAIQAHGRSIQAFVQDNGTPIDPGLDLCNTKGGYWADPEVFANTQDQYPFAYELSVIYSKANAQSKQAAEAFIAALTTDEGKCLLSEAGLVPLSPVRKTGVCQGASAP